MNMIILYIFYGVLGNNYLNEVKIFKMLKQLDILDLPNVYYLEFFVIFCLN